MHHGKNPCHTAATASQAAEMGDGNNYSWHDWVNSLAVPLGMGKSRVYPVMNGGSDKRSELGVNSEPFEAT